MEWSIGGRAERDYQGGRKAHDKPPQITSPTKEKNSEGRKVGRQMGRQCKVWWPGWSKVKERGIDK